MIRDLNFFLKKTIPNKTCLEWTGCFNTDGYPRCSWNGTYNGKVHRIVWELANKQSATGLCIRHTCDNPKCINPNHLLLGTPTQNIQDRTDRDRTQGLKQKDVTLIKHLFANKLYTAKELASMFKTSVRTIYYTIHKRK